MCGYFNLLYIYILTRVFYVDIISDTLNKSLSIVEWPLMACSKGVRATLLLSMPTIKFDFPSNKDSTAFTPRREAKTRSKQEGDPPRCM